MSFFLSKSLEGRISEQDLLADEPDEMCKDANEDLYPLSIKISDTTFEIKSLKQDRLVINLNYNGYKSYLKLIGKTDQIYFYIFDNLLFAKKPEDVFIDSYEKLSSNLIKLDIIINC